MVGADSYRVYNTKGIDSWINISVVDERKDESWTNMAPFQF